MKRQTICKVMTLLMVSFLALNVNAATFKISKVLNGNTEGAAPGTVTELNIQFTIVLGTSFKSSSTSVKVSLTKDGQSCGDPYMMAYESMTEIYARFQISGTDPGTYVLTIPAGYITDSNGATNEEWKGTWTVQKTAHAIDTEVVTPAPGQGLDQLGKTFTLSGTWKSVTAGKTPVMQLPAEGGNIPEVYGTASVVNGVATITFANNFTNPGAYTLIVPDNTFVNADGNYNASCNRQWTVKEQITEVTDMEFVNIMHGFMAAEEIKNGIIIYFPYASSGDNVQAKLLDASGRMLVASSSSVGSDHNVTLDYSSSLKPETSYTLVITKVGSWTGNLEEPFSVLKAVEEKEMGNVEWKNIVNGTFTGKVANDGVIMSLTGGKGYGETSPVEVKATLNGKDETVFNGTASAVEMFTGKLSDGNNTINILSINIMDNDGNLLIGWQETDEDKKNITFKVDTTSGISTVTTSSNSTAAYNITGQRTVQNRGIVIIDGKKMVKK